MLLNIMLLFGRTFQLGKNIWTHTKTGWSESTDW
jgi:hypothetical protein